MAVALALPRSFDLFEASGSKYYLRFVSGMEGKIQLTGAEVKTFDDLKKLGRVTQRGDAQAVELTDESRGKVVSEEERRGIAAFRLALKAWEAELKASTGG